MNFLKRLFVGFRTPTVAEIEHLIEEAINALDVRTTNSTAIADTLATRATDFYRDAKAATDLKNRLLQAV